MEQLAKQVKNDLLRTLFWLLISISIAGAIYYLVW